MMNPILDVRLFHWISAWLRQSPWDSVMSWVTHLGDSKVVLSLALLGLLESALKRARGAKAPLIPWLGIPAAAAVAQALKEWVGRARPVEVLPGIGLFAEAAGRSFPSGHATLAFALATVSALRWPRMQGLAWGLAALVAISRVALGLHWPSDVVAGAAIGVVTVALFRGVEERFLRRGTQ